MKNIRIRFATEDDFDRIVEMGRKFWEMTDYAQVPYDPDSIRYWCSMMLEQQLLLVAEVGGVVVGSVGAISAGLLGNVNYKVASELFWWIEEEYRETGLGVALLKGIEGAAREQGVKFFSMLALNAVNPMKVSELYLRSGYKLTEWNFTKDLNP